MIERSTSSVAEQLDALQVDAETRARVANLADQLFGHVLRVIDLDRLSGLEQCLWSELDRLEIDDELGTLATALLAEALHRVGHAPDRHCKTVPNGISDDEVTAAEYDDSCLMCRAEVDDMEYRLSGRQERDRQHDAKDGEMHQFVAAAAKAWRAENAEALERFGLARDARPSTTKEVTS